LTHNFFRVYLFQFPTCFEHLFAYHQENQLYQCYVWYMSLYVGDWCGGLDGTNLQCRPNNKLTFTNFYLDEHSNEGSAVNTV
jgi:hypothetical protein